MKLEGSFELFPLRELIDMVIYSSVVGVLNIFTDRGEGHIYFRDGALYHAEYGNSTGVNAIAELFEQDKANFAFLSEVASPEESIWGDLEYHLQVAERTAMRWRHIRAYIPDVDLIPYLLVPLEQARARVNPSFFPPLELIDGQRSLRAIANELAWAEIDIAEPLTQMNIDGLISLQRSRRSSIPREQPMDQKSPPGGLFDRTRTRSNSAAPAANSEPNRPTASDPLRTSNEDMVLQILRR